MPVGCRTSPAGTGARHSLWQGGRASWRLTCGMRTSAAAGCYLRQQPQFPVSPRPFWRGCGKSRFFPCDTGRAVSEVRCVGGLRALRAAGSRRCSEWSCAGCRTPRQVCNPAAVTEPFFLWLAALPQVVPASEARVHWRIKDEPTPILDLALRQAPLFYLGSWTEQHESDVPQKARCPALRVSDWLFFKGTIYRRLPRTRAR